MSAPEAALDVTEPCLHWIVRLEYSDEPATVARICMLCSASGSLPRCTGTTQGGERCKIGVMPPDEQCRYHHPDAISREAEYQMERAAAKEAARCTALTQRGVRCRHTALPGTLRCEQHSRPAKSRRSSHSRYQRPRSGR